ncbi:MAG: GNAT family N-acetyltransferase [Solobacterium sp.]|nr:GNAT family N-acetyltransferase [Solobacterium sp.]
MITLDQWPSPGRYELEKLYSEVHQKYCLVQLAVPLEENATQRYLQGIHTGVIDDKQLLCRAVRLDDQIIGKIDLNRYPAGAAEIDIVIAAAHTGNGYGAEALRQIISYVSEQKWCTAMHAYVHAENMHARKLFLKTGFRPGRRFQADVMIPGKNGYRFKTVDGYEYILYLQ